MSMKFYLSCTENVQEIVPYTDIRKCQGNLKISCHWEMYMKLEISWRFQGIRNSRLFPVTDTDTHRHTHTHTHAHTHTHTHTHTRTHTHTHTHTQQTHTCTANMHTQRAVI